MFSELLLFGVVLQAENRMLPAMARVRSVLLIIFVLVRAGLIYLNLKI